MTRRTTFSAAHADWLCSLTPDENRDVFGPGASPDPHGHNFVLDVSVRGRIDPATGIIVNIKEIDRIIREHIVRVFDGKFIDRQVPAFADRSASPENLLGYIRETLPEHLPAAVALTRLRIEETPLLAVEWAAKGRDQEITFMQLTRVYEFAASHRLHSTRLSDDENRELFGKCNYPHGHGHNYLLEVTVAGPVAERSGRVVDTGSLDAIVNREVVDRYDHRHLNYDIPELEGLVPSSEIVTKVIWERLQPHIPAPARLHRVVVRETARNFFEYQGEDSIG